MKYQVCPKCGETDACDGSDESVVPHDAALAAAEREVLDAAEAFAALDIEADRIIDTTGVGHGAEFDALMDRRETALSMLTEKARDLSALRTGRAAGKEAT